MTPRTQRLRRTTAIAAGLVLGVVIFGQPLQAGIPGSGIGPGATPTAIAGPAVYYVSVATGNDANNGLSLSAPFQHIQQCAAVAGPGSTCLIRQGTYHETVTPASSGQPGAIITYTAYAGEPVTLDGADLVTPTWTVQSGAIYQTTASVLPSSAYSTACLTTATLCANQVFFDGQMLLEARWPNTTVTMGDPGSELLAPTLAKSFTGTVAAISSDVQTIVDSGANGSMADAASNQWLGGTLGMWAGNGYMEQTATIDASTATTLTVHGITYRCNTLMPAVLCPAKNNSYFVEGVPRLLDAPGEWSYVPGTHTLSLEAPGGVDPTGHVVEAKARNFAFDLRGKSYITVSGLAIQAATIIMDTGSSHNTLDQLTVTYPSHYVTVPSVPITQNTQAGVSAQTYGLRDTGIVISGTFNTFSNGSVQYSAGNGVSEQGAFNVVTNTLLAYDGYAGGYGSGLYMEGHDNTASHLSIHDVGRDGVEMSSSRIEGYNYVQGTNSNPCSIGCPQFLNNTITYNDVWHAEALNRDGGEIYGCCEIAMTGTVLGWNMAHDNLSHSAFSPTPGTIGSYGAYIDNWSFGVLIHHLVAWGHGPTGTGGSVILNLAVNKQNRVYNVTSGSATILGVPAYDGIFATSSSQSTTEVKNSISTLAGLSSFTNATFATNLTTPPAYTNAAGGDYTLAAGSAAINAGTVISGITDGFSGAAPDVGAYEFGVTPWRPGCAFAACHDPYSVLAAQ